MAKEFTEFHNKLLELKADILSRNSTCEEVDVSGDEVDLVQGISIVETQNTLLKRDLNILSKIDAALKKFDNGDFGCCESCCEEIPIKRLRFSPYVEYCVMCKEEIERDKRR